MGEEEGMVLADGWMLMLGAYYALSLPTSSDPKFIF